MGLTGLEILSFCRKPIVKVWVSYLPGLRHGCGSNESSFDACPDISAEARESLSSLRNLLSG